LRFEKEVYETGDFQGTTVMNYAESLVPYTRIHEFRHYHEEREYPDNKTIIFREYSKSLEFEEEPYYPINTDRDMDILCKYDEECKKSGNVIFGGRQGSYKYLDMDKTIAAALQTYENDIRHYRS
jgi:UDP-galactopyranose mutase